MELQGAADGVITLAYSEDPSSTPTPQRLLQGNERLVSWGPRTDHVGQVTTELLVRGRIAPIMSSLLVTVALCCVDKMADEGHRKRLELLRPCRREGRGHERRKELHEAHGRERRT